MGEQDGLEDLRDFAQEEKARTSTSVRMMDVAKILNLSDTRVLKRLAGLANIPIRRDKNGGFLLNRDDAKTLIKLFYGETND